MITLRVTETASRMLKRAFEKPVLEGLRETMARENQFTVGHIRASRMTGLGPFPVSEHRLGVRTNRLRNSLRATSPRVVRGSVIASIGSNVVYAAAHEYGFRGPVTVAAHSRKQQSRNVSKAGRVGVKSGKFATGIAMVKPFTRMMNVPARAPIQYGINDRKPAYSKAMSESIITTLRGLGYK